MSLIFRRADDFVLIYYIDLPETCPTYYGPHSMDCLKTLWGMVKCLPEGHEYPRKLAAPHVNVLSMTNYTYDKFFLPNNNSIVTSHICCFN